MSPITSYYINLATSYQNIVTCDGFDEALKAYSEHPTYQNFLTLFRWVRLASQFISKCNINPNSKNNRISGISTLEQMRIIVKKARPISVAGNYKNMTIPVIMK